MKDTSQYGTVHDDPTSNAIVYIAFNADCRHKYIGKSLNGMKRWERHFKSNLCP